VNVDAALALEKRYAVAIRRCVEVMLQLQSESFCSFNLYGEDLLSLMQMPSSGPSSSRLPIVPS
jgi:hypothetical protein